MDTFVEYADRLRDTAVANRLIIGVAARNLPQVAGFTALGRYLKQAQEQTGVATTATGGLVPVPEVLTARTHRGRRRTEAPWNVTGHTGTAEAANPVPTLWFSADHWTTRPRRPATPTACPVADLHRDRARPGRPFLPDSRGHPPGRVPGRQTQRVGRLVVGAAANRRVGDVQPQPASQSKLLSRGMRARPSGLPPAPRRTPVTMTACDVLESWSPNRSGSGTAVTVWGEGVDTSASVTVRRTDGYSQSATVMPGENTEHEFDFPDSPPRSAP